MERPDGSSLPSFWETRSSTSPRVRSGRSRALVLSRTHGYPEGATIALEVGVVTFVILVVGEVAPKMYAMQRNVDVRAQKFQTSLRGMKIFVPSSALWTRWSAKLGGDDPGSDRPFVTAEELRTIVALSEERGTLEEDERDMIDSVMEFGDTVVSELMVPRVDMECFDDTVTVGEATDGIKELGFAGCLSTRATSITSWASSTRRTF